MSGALCDQAGRVSLAQLEKLGTTSTSNPVEPGSQAGRGLMRAHMVHVVILWDHWSPYHPIGSSFLRCDSLKLQ